MTAVFGYTPKQAERLMHKIDLAAAKTTDAYVEMHALVSDHGYDAAYLHEDVLTRSRILQDIVRRRTRGVRA